MRSSLLFSLISVALISSAQDAQRAIEIRDLLWNPNDSIFHSTEIPEKWEDEQAVILAVSNDLAYKKFPLSRNLWEQNHRHVRVKILGQQALEEYSQFSYPANITKYSFQGEIFVGFKIIKPNGETIIVDEKEAVREELESSGNSKYGMMKLAIPNLEIGDILDYYLAEELTFYTDKFHDFDPEIFVLRRSYPILNGRISFNVLRRCFINLGTFNDAPEFQLEEDEDKDESRYVLNYSNQESIDGIPYFYPYRSVPNIKFKVTYASPMAAYQYPSLVDKDDPGVLKSNVSPDELKDYVTQVMGLVFDYSALNKYMKKNFKGVSDREQLVNEAYLYLRNKYSVASAESYTVNESGTPGFSSFYGVKALTNYFKKAKISYKLFVAVPRYIGDTEDILLEEEVIVGLKVENPDIYIGNFSAHGQAGEISAQLDGTQVYMSNVNNLINDNWKFVLEDLPATTKEENISSSYLDVSLDLSQGISMVDIRKKASGYFKQDEQELVMDFYDYEAEEGDKYDMESFVNRAMTKSVKETRQKLVEEYMDGREKTKIKAFKEQAKNGWEFELDSLYDLTVKNTGRQVDNKEFEYAYKFTSNDLFTKVGPNYLVNIGLLIESQVKIEQAHFENREYDIYMNYPRTYTSEISVQVPEGFEVQGLEQLDFNVTNGTGGFISRARLEGDLVNISVEKYYAHSFEPKENWDSILQYIKAANDFTQQKILLKKK